MGKWPIHTLIDLCDSERDICYGIVQPGSHVEDGVPVVRVNNIRNGVLDTRDVIRVSQEIESKYSRSRLKGGEVLLTLVGSIGETAIAPEQLAGWNVARAVGVIPVKKDIGTRWVHFVLQMPESQYYIRTYATTTVQATFNLRDLAKLPIPLPPKNEREAIVALLGALDDTIDLNRHMNKTLEAMARALFKDWFVDFGPTRAKVEGRSPYLVPDLWSLFPEAFNNDHKPMEWRETNLSTLTSKIGSGATPRGGNAVYVNEGIHFIRSQNIYDHRFVWDGLVKICEEDAERLRGVGV